ncbi:predicted protein [Nematostella vectensis]|uniref:Kinesin motor domain-containing protein n=1 Tax=Nematostella vectensis TaxID=45351 RepID=A7S2P8_NEMVE|nr:predicted protein [Nematostella vectensis]|eukprot:XP_001634106.1 predicted protein [Nematostella vectensis]
MPEPTENILKERVQKLERLLRAREERIVALETENAMLYLKLAECQGTVRSSRYESSHFRRLFEAEEGFKKNVTKSIKTCYSEVRELKENLNSLKSVVAQMPEELSTYVEKAKFKTTKFGSEEMTNMEKMQSKLMETEMQLDMALQRAAAEKDRRKTLHNTLVVSYSREGCSSFPSNPSTKIKSRNNRTAATNIRIYNVCIMAYGQTGSGKTHTMLGSHDIDVEMDSEQLNKDEGIIPRAAKELFR